MPTIVDLFCGIGGVAEAVRPDPIASRAQESRSLLPYRIVAAIGIDRRVGRLMGFRDEFRWPSGMSRRARYRLLGNALAVPVVRSLLASFRWGYAENEPR